jgi:hypothetical protein
MWQYVHVQNDIVTTCAIDIACENAVVLTWPGLRQPCAFVSIPNRSPAYGQPISGVGKFRICHIHQHGRNYGDSLAQHFENEGWCSGAIHFFKLVMHFLVNFTHVHILLSFLGSNIGQKTTIQKKSPLSES